MTNWVKTFLEQNPQQASWPIEKRAKHSIHFKRPDGQIEANFTGAPCHYLDSDNMWKPLDTKLIKASSGFYGAPGLDVLAHPDGRVKVNNSDYQQFTELPGNPKGKEDGDRIVREFVGGRQYLYITETGFREEIILDKKPTHHDKFLASKIGKLPNKYIKREITLIDNNEKRFIYSGNINKFANWLDGAIYPVTIDPDFVSGTSYGNVYGENATYSICRSTSSGSYKTAIYIGQSTVYIIYRGYLKYDTNTIPDADTVTQVNQKMVCISNSSATDFDIQIVKQDWSAQDPLSDANREAAYDNCLSGTADDNIWRNTNGIDLNTQYASGNLSTAWVNKTGITYYSLRSAEDYNNSVPTNNEYIQFGQPDHATEAYRPILTVVYTSFIPRIIMI